MYDSPYLWVNSPWKLAVRKDGDAMELVGSVPNLYKLWFEEDEQISEEKDDLDWEVDFALNGMDTAQEESGYNPDNEEQMCDDEKTSQKGNLDDLILAAERMKWK